MSLDLSTLVGFDTETTGVKPYEADTKIVTAAFIRSEVGKPDQVLEWFMDPGIEIPTGASDVHGITTEVARAQGSDYREGIEGIMNVIRHTVDSHTPLVAYNGSFDCTLIREEAHATQVTDREDPLWGKLILIDPYVIDRYLTPFRRGKGMRKLGIVAGLYGYDLTNAHDATADVLATLHLARIMLPKLKSKIARDYEGDSIDSFSDLMVIQKTLYELQQTGLENYFKRNDPDSSINKLWPYSDPNAD